MWLFGISSKEATTSCCLNAPLVNKEQPHNWRIATIDNRGSSLKMELDKIFDA
jgi:hypothetical protein